MFFNTLTTTLPILLLSTLHSTCAAPAPPSTNRQHSELNKGNAGIMACHGSNYAPPCEYYAVPKNKCYNIRSKNNWDQYTTLIPNPGIYCWTYEEEACLGDLLEISWPGTENLRGLKWDNKVRSWICWDNEFRNFKSGGR